MGLDQYAYATTEELPNSEMELAYWRKHNRLQGWMEDLWIDKGKPNAKKDPSPMGDFNCIPLELTLSDLEQLEAHVENKQLPSTSGFFFGEDSFETKTENGETYQENDYAYKEEDLAFIEKARQAIADGKKVFYNCWW
jgi:hypothetical protein